MDKFKVINKVSFLSIFINSALLILKALIGFITNSQSMLADAFNSATDIFSSIMTNIGNRIATTPPDTDHQLGHGKAEYLYSLLISITMGLISLSVLKNSLLGLFTPTSYLYSNYLIIVCLITILTKLLLYIYTRKLSHQYQSLLLETNAKDHLNDCLLTFLNLIACLLSLKNIPFVDNLAGIIISFCILVTAVKIFLQSYDILMDKALTSNLQNQIIRLVLSEPQVYYLANFRSHPLGTLYQVSFTIHLRSNLSLTQITALTTNLETQIKTTFSNIVTVLITVRTA